MRLGCLDGEAVVVREIDKADGVDDAPGRRPSDPSRRHEYAALAGPSAARFATPDQVYADWDGFRAWIADAADSTAPVEPIGSTAPTDSAASPALHWLPLDLDRLQAPVPRPGQVFGVGLNFHSHLVEGGRAGERPLPLTFTKFPSSITGPYNDVEIPFDGVDYEVELVLVIGRHADRIAAADAWDHVAGVTVGQDLSARGVQQGGQLSLAKSFRGFAPIGPWVRTVDELVDRDALTLRCHVDDEPLQHGSTADMVHDVPELLAFLSTVTALRPGDIVFTGTPSGVGFFRDPQRFLRAGEVLRSEIDGVGVIENRCVEPKTAGAYDDAFRALAVRPPKPA
jgi:2-keto-4-pentenoate hydratase/2-oxohepta-3-ene-1,7-dioic acid hydratase in catechol pathway